jgi:hypothetical protein
MSDQLPLFTEPNGNGRRPTKHDLGLRETKAGPERLLGALVREGLSVEALPTAAAICLLLDEGSE